METDVHEPESNIRLDTDFVWESTKANVKKMRNNNVPIKINFFKYLGENRKEKFGYVILNLRSAQYIPKNKTVETLEDHVKILGLGKEAKGTSPLLFKSLRYAKTIEIPVVSVRFVSDPFFSFFAARIRDKTGEFSKDRKNLELEKKATTRTSEIVSESIGSGDKICPDDPDRINNPDGFEEGETNAGQGEGLFDVEGSPVLLCEMAKRNPNRSPRTRHSLASESLKKRTSSDDDETGNPGFPNSRKLIQAYHDYKLEIRLRDVFWSKVPPKFSFRFHHSR